MGVHQWFLHHHSNGFDGEHGSIEATKCRWSDEYMTPSVSQHDLIFQTTLMTVPKTKKRTLYLRQNRHTCTTQQWTEVSLSLHRISTNKYYVGYIGRWARPVVEQPSSCRFRYILKHLDALIRDMNCILEKDRQYIKYCRITTYCLKHLLVSAKNRITSSKPLMQNSLFSWWANNLCYSHSFVAS